MITHRTKIRRHLRSARVAALTPEERREELRAAERRIAQDDGRTEPATDRAPDPDPGSRAEDH